MHGGNSTTGREKGQYTVFKPADCGSVYSPECRLLRNPLTTMQYRPIPWFSVLPAECPSLKTSWRFSGTVSSARSVVGIEALAIVSALLAVDS